MDQAFYIGAVGAHQQLRHLNIQGDNIANVKSQGYKAHKARFANLMYQKDSRTAGDAQDKGVGTRVMMTGTDFGQGPAADTGRVMDYMIYGRGFFAVREPDTGEISYTRNGAFKMSEMLTDTGETDEEGQPVMEAVFYLSDGLGRMVLDQNEELIPLDSPNQEDLPIGIFDFDNYDGMIDLDGTRFQPVAKNGEVRPGSGTLIGRYLESSNMDLAEALTKVIEAQRAYGLALKVVQTSDEVETTINNLRG